MVGRLVVYRRRSHHGRIKINDGLVVHQGETGVGKDRIEIAVRADTIA